MSVVSKRYARGVVDAVLQNDTSNTTDLVHGLKVFQNIYHESTELQDILNNPVFQQERESALLAVMAEMQLTQQVQNLLRLLTLNKRLDVIDDVIEEVGSIVDKQQNLVRSHVISAIPLDQDQVVQITNILEQRFKQNIHLEVDVDASVMGGLVCRVGDVTIDLSLKHRLEQMGEQLADRAVS